MHLNYDTCFGGQCNRLANATHVNLILCVSGYGVKAAANNATPISRDHRRRQVVSTVDRSQLQFSSSYVI